MGTLSGISEATLAKPAKPNVPSFDQKISGNLVFFGYHETYHVGQLAYLTKWVGGGQIVG
jgi:hypothetical protein